MDYDIAATAAAAANLDFLQVWGPYGAKEGDDPQYRRVKGKGDDKWGGGKADDLSAVVGIWLPKWAELPSSPGWKIYAQVIRRVKTGKLGQNPPYKVVGVCRLWPPAYGLDRPGFKEPMPYDDTLIR